MIAARRWFSAVAVSLALASTAWSQVGVGEATLSVHYRDADLRQVISAVAQVTGKGFIIHPDVNAKITYGPSNELTATEYYDALVSILQANGYEAVLLGETTHIVPIGVAPGTGSPPLSIRNSAVLDGAIRPTPYFLNGQLWGVAFFPGRNRIRFNALGFRPGDVITEYDGVPLLDMRTIQGFVEKLAVSEVSSVVVMRNERRISLQLD